MLVGAGARDRFAADIARRIGGIAGLTARQRRAPRVSVLLRGLDTDAPQLDRRPLRMLQAVAEGVMLGTLDTGLHKSTPVETGTIDAITLVIQAGVAPIDDAQRAVDRGRILGDATNDARMLANEPANVLTPTCSPAAQVARRRAPA